MTQARPHRRQELVSWLGSVGQDRLARAAVLVTRVGGLGGAVCQALALAGIGRIVLFHEGALLKEDLHRMALMDATRVGDARAPQAAASLRRLAPNCEIRAFSERITEESAQQWAREVDVTVGAAPTFAERLMLNRASVSAGTPFIDAAMYGDEAQLFCVRPPETACLECLLPAPPPWTDDFPVLAAVSATIGNLAALCAIRALVAPQLVPWGQYLHLDTVGFQLSRTKVPRRVDCPTCRA